MNIKPPLVRGGGFTALGIRGDDVVAAISAELPLLRQTLDGKDTYVGVLIVMRHSRTRWLECGPPIHAIEPAVADDEPSLALRTMLCDAVEGILGKPDAWSLSSNLPQWEQSRSWAGRSA